MRLRSNFSLRNELLKENIIVNGDLFCCGQDYFEIIYWGKLKKNLLGCHGLSPREDGIVLLAKCIVCGNVITVFDSYTDGYDGCICNSLSPQLSGLLNFACTKCKNCTFSLSLSLEYPPKDEMINDGIQEFDNAFSWIWISLTCHSCKHEYDNVVDMETA